MRTINAATLCQKCFKHRIRIQLSILFILITSIIAQPVPAALQVISTNPPNGATNVSVNLTGASITFNDEVSTKSSGYSTEVDFWGPLGPTQWEGTTLRIFRFTQTPLPVGVTIRITLSSIYDKLGNPFPYTLAFMVGTDVDMVPTVIATDPADGAVGVSRDLETVSVTFSEPMDDCCHSITHNFPSFTLAFSQDHRVMYMTRSDTQKRLSAGVTYTFNLLGGDSGGLRDTQGNRLPDTTFSFKTAEDYDAQILKIDEDPAKGFEWPYYLSIPDTLSSNTILLVEPNNTGTSSDDLDLHDAAALSLVKWWTDFAIELDVPLLVPTFPRPATPAVPGGIYTHALDRYSLETNLEIEGHSIERIDLQLIAMIRDAQQRLSAMGFKMDRKVFIKGFSASGAFTSRFTLLHPEIVRAAAPGSPGGWPLAPVGTWWSIPLRYPIGISDVETLTGKPFDLTAVRNVPQYIYVGDYDQNDALDTRELPQTEIDVICSHLDCRPAPYISDRWPISESMYVSAGILNTFTIYPGVAHIISDEMYAGLLEFFEAHKPSKSKAAPWIPLLMLGD